MARRSFQVIDVVEVLQHWHAGRPKTVVAASLGVDVKTVRKYVSAAEADGICPGDGLVIDRAGWAGRVAAWFPELCEAKARSRTWPELDARRELITSMVASTTLATAYQRLRDEHGLTVSESSLRRYVALVLPDRSGPAVTVLRPAVPPGEGQIDYGYLGRWVDPVGGRARKVNAFVMLLACCRHMFVRPVFSMDQSSWTAAHVAGFEFFGGVPDRLVIDNLKTGVVRPDLYDPLLNRAYAEMAEHYGALIDPARALKPKDKARVERMMPYVRDSFWRGRSFASLADMQARAATLVPAGRRRPLSPRPGRRQPSVGVRRRRGAGVAAVAGPAVRAGPLGIAEGRPRLSHRGRQGALLGAVRPCREDHRHPGLGHHGGGPRRRRAGQDLAEGDPGAVHRPGRLPAGEDRVLRPQPGLVPPPRRRARPVGRGAGRDVARPARPASPAGRPGGARPGLAAQPGPAGRGVRPGTGGR